MHIVVFTWFVYYTHTHTHTHTHSSVRQGNGVICRGHESAKVRFRLFSPVPSKLATFGNNNNTVGIGELSGQVHCTFQRPTGPVKLVLQKLQSSRRRKCWRTEKSHIVSITRDAYLLWCGSASCFRRSSLLLLYHIRQKFCLLAKNVHCMRIWTVNDRWGKIF